MDLFCISPFPDGREKIQSRLKAGKEALTSYYETAIPVQGKSHLQIPSRFRDGEGGHVNPVKNKKGYSWSLEKASIE
jgi:hypothetical protein